jgi:hypothetical protein
MELSQRLKGITLRLTEQDPGTGIGELATCDLQPATHCRLLIFLPGWCLHQPELRITEVK